MRGSGAGAWSVGPVKLSESLFDRWALDFLVPLPTFASLEAWSASRCSGGVGDEMGGALHSSSGEDCVKIFRSQNGERRK